MAERGAAGWFTRRIRHPIEAGLLFLLMGTIRLIPADAASAIGGKLFRWLGPLLPVTKVAHVNLRLALPERQAEHRQIVRDMWENLGRTAFEYPHLGRLSHPESGRVEVVNEKPLADAYFGNRPGVYFGGHLGNFEVVPLYAARRGLTLHAFARPPNNPLLAKVIAGIRGTGGARMLAKHAVAGMVSAIHVLRENGYLAVLIDQKQNRGAPIPFFGHEAMTAIVPAQLALRFNAAVLIVRTERLKGARYRFTVSDPLELPNTGDRDADALELTRRITLAIEGWIREKPGDWLWLHRRWPNEVYYRPEQLAARKRKRQAARAKARAGN